MDLDNYQKFAQLDSRNMLGEIEGLPQQLQAAWDLGQSQPLPAWQDIRQVVVAGMGGSAIGADLLSAYAAPLCLVPITIHRDYELPAWARGEQTLVIASSHSGNTEETLTSLESALAGGCRVLAVATGGKLAAAASEAISAGKPAALWTFTHKGQPRAAVGYSFGLLLAALARLRLVPDPAAELASAVTAMQRVQPCLAPSVPVTQNPAKRAAGQLMGRLPSVIGAGLLAPVARRWKGQVSEIAKAWAQFEFLPEADHNTLAGAVYPQEVLSRLVVLFLRTSFDHPRNQLRCELTRKALMLEGIGTDFYDAQGDTRLAQQWTLLHFGDYTAYYLAMAYEVDPTPVEALENFKMEMKSGG
jgi:glucose/mannose-6-phosphate isomerase